MDFWDALRFFNTCTVARRDEQMADIRLMLHTAHRYSGGRRPAPGEWLPRPCYDGCEPPPDDWRLLPDGRVMDAANLRAHFEGRRAETVDLSQARRTVR